MSSWTQGCTTQILMVKLQGHCDLTSIQFLSTKHHRNISLGCLHIWHAFSPGLRDEQIRFWWSSVKVMVDPHWSHSRQSYISKTCRGFQYVWHKHHVCQLQPDLVRGDIQPHCGNSSLHLGSHGVCLIYWLFYCTRQSNAESWKNTTASLQHNLTGQETSAVRYTSCE